MDLYTKNGTVVKKNYKIYLILMKKILRKKKKRESERVQI